MTCKKEDQVDDGSQRSKGRGLSRWGAGSLFILRYLAVNRWREATHSSIIARESRELGNLVDYSPWGHTESDMTGVT